MQNDNHKLKAQRMLGAAPLLDLKVKWTDVTVLDVRDISFLIMVRGLGAGKKVHKQLISKFADIRRRKAALEAAKGKQTSTAAEL